MSNPRPLHSVRPLALLLTIITLATTLTTAALAQAPPIRLHSGTFFPGQGERPALPPGLTISEYAQNERGYYIVQFAGPIQQGWKDSVEAEGADLLGYLPEFAFKVRMNPGTARRVERMDEVIWVGIFQPAFKLSSSLDRQGTNLYQIRIEQGADFGLTRAAVARTGATLLRQTRDLMVVAADDSQLEAIARVLDVAWIENYRVREKHNDYGAGVILGSATANANGYDGSTQTVAVADTGIGDGTPTGAHPDIPSSRVSAIFDWVGTTDLCFSSITNDGPYDVDSGHGTHVAVTVLGEGGVAGEGKGTAPAAHLVFQATENWTLISAFCQLLGGLPPSGYFLTGLPDDLHNLFQQAYNAGARIHSNSWGAAQNGLYTADSANTDDFIWDNPDMTITVSAGNSGADANNNGVVDNDSINSPATAKNVITVGASEGERADNFPCDTGLTYTSSDAYQSGQTCNSMGGHNVLGTAGARWGFSTEPLKSDVTGGNSEQMAPFSSRGPTDDGRIKPDVVAPGTWIVSGYSPLFQRGYGDPQNPQNGAYQYDGWGLPLNQDYKYMGGTSMSSPLTAGAAAVVRDFYQKTNGHSASAALVKASLINSAVDLLDENNDGANDNDFPIPNVHEGWGRVDLAAATDGSHQYVDNTSGLTTGGSVTQQFSIVTPGWPFRVSLVWTDFPSTEAAAQNLVNNLNLTVTSPGGTVYRGNVFSGGWSQTGGTADNINNVENVYVQSAASGTWSVQVSAPNVPNGPQPFALVVDGAFGVVNQPPSTNLISPASGATVVGTVLVRIMASDNEDPAGTLSVQWNVDGGTWQSAPYNGTTGYYEASWNTVSNADGSHTVNARATDSSGNTGSDSNVVTVDNVNEPPTASFSYSCTNLSCSFNGSGSSDPDGTIATYQWNFGDGSTGSGQTTNHSYASAGTFNVTLTVTDNKGATDSDVQSITVSTAPAGSVHVGDLDGSSSDTSRGRWNATVSITVHNQSHGLVSGALVEGAWSNGTSGTGSCTTNGSGLCSVTKSNLKGNLAAVSFTVNNVTSSTGAYQSSANHDPDGDSNGTGITVNKPGSNTPPTATITAPSDGATFTSGSTVNFTGSANDAEDGTLTSNLVWTSSIDGQIGTGGSFSASLHDGSHLITATVTDSAGAGGSDMITITVGGGGGGGGGTMHVGDLDGSAKKNKNWWSATAEILVHDGNHNPVPNATVTGTFSTSGGNVSCVTDSSGWCSITERNIGLAYPVTSFFVVSVTATGYTYNSSLSHDPDGESVMGLAINIYQP